MDKLIMFYFVLAALFLSCTSVLAKGENSLAARMTTDKHVDLVLGYEYRVKHVGFGNRTYVTLEGCYGFYDVDAFTFYQNDKVINIREAVKYVRVGIVDVVRKMILGGQK